MPKWFLVFGMQLDGHKSRHPRWLPAVQRRTKRRRTGGIAQRHGLATDRLQPFTDTILQSMVFDGGQLTELMEPLRLGWRERRVKELALKDELVPRLKKRTAGRDISGLSAYES